MKRNRIFRTLLACLLLLALIVPILGGCAEKPEAEPQEETQEPTENQPEEAVQPKPARPTNFALVSDVEEVYDKNDVSFTLTFGFWDCGSESDPLDLRFVGIEARAGNGKSVMLREERGEIGPDAYNAYIDEETEELVIAHSETVHIPEEIFVRARGDLFYLYTWTDCGVYNRIAIPYEMNGDEVVILAGYIGGVNACNRCTDAYYDDYLPSLLETEDEENGDSAETSDEAPADEGAEEQP